MFVIRLHLGRGTETETMSEEERIALAISSLITYFQARDYSKGSTMAETTRKIFVEELRVANTSLAGRTLALGLENARFLQ